ncbi:MAG: hypothetical protein HYZ63_02355 [Candidatus Andersenbacteria bacterium]|nr:hypothetical protein [Candidatus Andersenbacteria bacterium]
MSVAAACVRGVCVCLLPRDDNNFKPLALRHKPLALVSAFLIAIKVATIGAIALTPSTADLSTITVNRIIQLTNAERKKAGVGELKTNGKLMSAAQMKGEDMLAHDYFAHISPSGVTPWFWMAKTGYTYQVAGENLAIDFTEAEDVVTAWLASPSHHDNMLRSDYTETGVAVVSGEFEGGTSIVVVHMFGKPSVVAQVAASAATPTPTAPTPTPAVSKPKTTATPTPSATPTIAPLPIQEDVPPPDTTAPRVPRISPADGSTSVQERAQLFIEGEESSIVHLLVNTQEQAQTALSQAGKAVFALDVSSYKDGELEVRGYATDEAKNASALSDPLKLQKDTQAPDGGREELVFLVSPITEAADVAIYLPQGEHVRLAVSQQSESLRPANDVWAHLPVFSDPITVSFTDEAGNTNLLANIDIQPRFSLPEPTPGDSFAVPRQISAWGRTFTVTALLVVLMLLVLAVVVRIRIQHPALITHASFVILLAAVLLAI